MDKKWLILSAVACGTFMATLDSSIVNVALPSITSSFHTGLSYSRWVIIAYLFSITSLLLLFGKLADLIGRRLIFLSGFFFFTFGSMLCAISRNIIHLISARGIQGLGAAMLMANGPAIITAAFPKTERGKALGTLAMVVSSGLALGPSLGGFFVSFFSWQSIFLVNIPFGLLGMALVSKYVPPNFGMPNFGTNDHNNELNRELLLPFHMKIQLIINKLRYFDWLGIIFWIFIQFGYSLAIDRENVLGLAGPLQQLISFGSAGLLLLFITWELSVKDPVLDLTLFKTKLFLHANLSGLFCFIATSSIQLLMPFYLQNVRGLSPHKVGILMTIIPLTIFFVAPISGRLSDKYGSKALTSIGISLVCGAMLVLSLPFYGLTTENTTLLIPYLIVIGTGIGLFQSPNNNAIMGTVDQAHLGMASALLATVRNFGLVTGAALSTTLLMNFYNDLSNLIPSGLSPSENFILALQKTFIALTVLCSIGIFTSLTRGNESYAKEN